jgi:hypothetical protein
VHTLMAVNIPDRGVAEFVDIGSGAWRSPLRLSQGKPMGAVHSIGNGLCLSHRGGRAESGRGGRA